jgi:Ca2+-binding RTX toxin-like protein
MTSLSKPSSGSPDVAFGLYIQGTNLNDLLNGTAYADQIHGGLGADSLYGNAGDDFIFGEGGADMLFGGSGNDTLDGGISNDILVGGSGADLLIGGEGFDTANYSSAATFVHVNLATNAGFDGDARGDTFSSIERVVGSNFDDRLVGDDDGSVLEGGAGNDVLIGGAGFDVLVGGLGRDVLEGGAGIDVLTGGGGDDRFSLGRGDGLDVITDFEQGIDRIVLGSGFEWDHHLGPFGLDRELARGTEVPINGGGIPQGGGGGGDQLFYDTDDYVLYQLNGDHAPTALATFSTPVQLQTTDFWVVGF